MTEAAHHAWGPSSLKQKINCLASDQATRGLPDTDTEAALSGTATHSLVEFCREHDVPAKDYLGKKITVNKVDGSTQEFLVDQARVDSAQTFIDHINGLPGIDFNEQRVRYPEWVPGAFGTLDGARANDGVVYLRDFKDGGMLVFAKDNEQLLGQALGFYRDWGHLFEIEEFDLGIVQPRRDHIDTWRVSLEYVLNWATTVLKLAYERAQGPSPPFTPGEWCTFCKIRGTCAARAQSVFEDVVDQFDDLDDAVAGAAQKKFVAGVLGNEQIAKILPVIPNIKAWCSDIQRYAFAEVRSGRPVGDYKIVEGKLGDRAFIPGAEAKILETAAKIESPDTSVDEVIDMLYEPRKLKGPAQVEKVLGKPLFKPATEKKPAGALHELIVRPPGKPTLVPGDDGRPAMVFDAASAFEEVDDFE
ncbi:MAG: DUF2800 domain-containing protein [Nocardiaceae bacterium]|nr:DUF2800 domain-containing protein [Nocardiaceae bacterium]